MFETKKKRELREREEERLENLRKAYGRMKAVEKVISMISETLFPGESKYVQVSKMLARGWRKDYEEGRLSTEPTIFLLFDKDDDKEAAVRALAEMLDSLTDEFRELIYKKGCNYTGSGGNESDSSGNYCNDFREPRIPFGSGEFLLK